MCGQRGTPDEGIDLGIAVADGAGSQFLRNVFGQRRLPSDLAHQPHTIANQLAVAFGGKKILLHLGRCRRIGRAQAEPAATLRMQQDTAATKAILIRRTQAGKIRLRTLGHSTKQQLVIRYWRGRCGFQKCRQPAGQHGAGPGAKGPGPQHGQRHAIEPHLMKKRSRLLALPGHTDREMVLQIAPHTRQRMVYRNAMRAQQ